MERVEVEQLAFLYLCSSKDSAMVNGEESMSIRDLERLSYILSKLGFIELELQLLMRQIEADRDRIEELIEIYGKEEIIVKEILDFEHEVYEAWLKAFCKTAPTVQVQERLIELFNLDI